MRSVLLEGLFDFLYPKKCLLCDLNGVFLCEVCRKRLDRVIFKCPMCCQRSVAGKTHENCLKRYGLNGLTSVYNYKDEGVRRLIEEIKYGFNRNLVEILMGDVNVNFKAGIVVPVPLHWLRKNWRGFNQAELIGKNLANKLGVATIECIKRVRNTKQQARIKNKEERFENIKNAFEFDGDIGLIEGKRIVIVDDVYTSGASMRECARILKKAGAKSVWGFTLAS